MAAATRTPRPHRIITFRDFEIVDGVEVVTETTIVQEFGRRAGLHTSKSQTTDHRRRANRNERRGTRVALRRNPDAVWATPRKNDSVWLTR